MIQAARNLAIEAHKGQKRKWSDEPYIVHPVNVKRILETVTTDREVLAAGYLHDVLEDTLVTENQLRAFFGDRVTNIVLEVTSNKGKFNIRTKKE